MTSLAKNYAAANLATNAASSSTPQPKDFKELERLVLEKVQRVLGNGFADKRARTLDVDDFIKLLVEFNKESIHFA
jgi:18S rRNA (adenine1779-N6/adenine1780-N6)-dimethyltransferase